MICNPRKTIIKRPLTNEDDCEDKTVNCDNKANAYSPSEPVRYIFLILTATLFKYLMVIFEII